jgi:hypothetical protein
MGKITFAAGGKLMLNSGSKLEFLDMPPNALTLRVEDNEIYCDISASSPALLSYFANNVTRLQLVIMHRKNYIRFIQKADIGLPLYYSAEASHEEKNITRPTHVGYGFPSQTDGAPANIELDLSGFVNNKSININSWIRNLLYAVASTT